MTYVKQRKKIIEKKRETKKMTSDKKEKNR